MATHSIPEPLAARPPRPNSLARGKGAIVTLAHQLAKKAVQEQLRSEGKQLSRMRAAEIDAKARWYLKDHPELHWAAFERAKAMGLIDTNDWEFFQALLEFTRYLCRGADRETDSAKSGTGNIEKLLALKG